MEANLYQLDGKTAKKVELPQAFTKDFRIDLVRRALLAEQSLRYQPQAHSLMAGLNTTAVYVGEYGVYRAGRHTGQAIRPRQKLAGGGMGDVRRIPSATKGRRAHPHKIEKKIIENINVREYRKALESAVAGTSKDELIKAKHAVKEETLPIIMVDAIENVSKTKELIKILIGLGLKEEIERSHDPKIRKGLRRYARMRRFRKSVLIVVKNDAKVGKAGRNIPGVDVRNVSDLRVENLAPGAMPRVSIWSESSLQGVQELIDKARL